jgi:hypothetical protein
MMKSMKPSTVASTYCHPRTKSTTTLAATKITPNSHEFMHTPKKKKKQKKKKNEESKEYLAALFWKPEISQRFNPNFFL